MFVTPHIRVLHVHIQAQIWPNVHAIGLKDRTVSFWQMPINSVLISAAILHGCKDSSNTVNVALNLKCMVKWKYETVFEIIQEVDGFVASADGVPMERGCGWSLFG